MFFQIGEPQDDGLFCGDSNKEAGAVHCAGLLLEGEGGTPDDGLDAQGLIKQSDW